MLDRARGLVEGLVVYPERMQANLEPRRRAVLLARRVLLALVETGMARQEAYVLVQRNAMRAWRGDGAFRDNLGADADVSSRLSAQTLAKLFDLDHALQHVPGIVERALATAP